MQQTAPYESLEQDITLIDTQMIRPGLAACYLLEQNGKAAIIETGTSHTVPCIMETIAAKGLSPEQVEYVIPTHVHLDHAGGAGGLMEKLPNATLLIHPRGARHMIDPSVLQAGTEAVYGEAHFRKVYGRIVPIPQERVRSVQDGEIISLNGRELLFLDTPGHALHHFCIFDKTSGGLFTGDTLGIAYREITTRRGAFLFPTTTPVQFDPHALKNSIARLMALKPRVAYLTHFGPLAHPEQFSDQLVEQIDEYVRIAQDLKQAKNPVPLIHQQLVSNTLNRLQKLGCEQSEDFIAEHLAMDLKLNADGLGVWLKRNG